MGPSSPLMSTHSIDTSAPRTGNLTQPAPRTGHDWLTAFGRAVRFEDRLETLHLFGVNDADLQKVTGVAARSLRRWRANGAPRSKVASSWEHVDDLIVLINYLLADGSLDRDAILAWLRSRNWKLSGNRPLDMLGEGDFRAVFAALEDELLLLGSESGNTFFARHPPTVEPSGVGISARERGRFREDYTGPDPRRSSTSG